MIFGRFSSFHGQRSVTAAWATRSPWSIIQIILSKIADFQAFFCFLRPAFGHGSRSIQNKSVNLSCFGLSKLVHHLKPTAITTITAPVLFNRVEKRDVALRKHCGILSTVSGNILTVFCKLVARFDKFSQLWVILTKS